MLLRHHPLPWQERDSRTSVWASAAEPVLAWPERLDSKEARAEVRGQMTIWGSCAVLDAEDRFPYVGMFYVLCILSPWGVGCMNT